MLIGDETDGTVIPQDLNLQCWALSKKRIIWVNGHTVAWLIEPLEVGGAGDRGWLCAALTGLMRLPGGDTNGQHNTRRVTSTYFADA
jgi:sarcosine oxidase subunit alpha